MRCPLSRPQAAGRSGRPRAGRRRQRAPWPGLGHRERRRTFGIPELEGQIAQPAWRRPAREWILQPPGRPASCRPRPAPAKRKQARRPAVRELLFVRPSGPGSRPCPAPAGRGRRRRTRAIPRPLGALKAGRRREDRCRRVPEPDRSVVTPRRKLAAPRGERERRDSVGMTLERGPFAEALEVPELHSRIKTARGERPAPRREREPVDHIAVTGESDSLDGRRPRPRASPRRPRPPWPAMCRRANRPGPESSPHGPRRGDGRPGCADPRRSPLGRPLRTRATCRRG